MALKPNTIKALFGNLKMDSLDPVLKSQILQDTAEDTTRLLKYMDSKAQYGQYPYRRFQSNPAIRNALQSEMVHVGGTPVAQLPVGGIMNDAVDFIRANDTPYSDVNTHELFRALDSATDASPVLDFYPDIDPSWYDNPTARYYEGSGSLVQDDYLSDIGYFEDFESHRYRPHKGNTKLHQWYNDTVSKMNNAQQMSRWNVPKDLGSEEFDDLPF
jgi:hypothetical protein